MNKKIKFNKILIFIYFWIFVLGIYMFLSGYTLFDTGHNLNYLSLYFNKEIVDIATDGKLYSSYDYIIIGANRLKIGFVLCITSMFEIGYLYDIKRYEK